MFFAFPFFYAYVKIKTVGNGKNAMKIMCMIVNRSSEEET